MNTVLEVANVEKYYGNKGNLTKALDKISFQVEEGEFVGIMGASGSGKTTLLNCLSTIDRITSGKIVVDDVDITRLKGNHLNRFRREELGFIFQDFNLLDTLTAYENIALALTIQRVKPGKIEKDVKKVAEQLGITAVLNKYPYEMSGGQKQRVAIGSAIIRKPKAFLMDEPLSNLDAKLRAQMRIELAKLHRELGTTMIYVTHDQTEAMTLGTRIVVMKDGVVQQVESPANIYNNPRNQFVAGFIGSPSMNFFDAYIGEEEGRTTLYLGGTELGKKVYVDGSRGQLLKEQENGKKVVIGIRPEDIWEYEDAVHRGFDEASVDIVETITAREMPGAEVILYFDAQNKSHAVRLRPDNQTRTGEKLQLYFDPEKLHVFDKETGENLFYREEVSV